MTNSLRRVTRWVLLAALVALGWAVAMNLRGMGYSWVSQQSSPDGRWTIHEFLSHSDGFGHAPYGTLLALSGHRPPSSPDEGYVFFAGHCQKLQYRWDGNHRVTIFCESWSAAERLPPNQVRTLASRMYGIDVLIHPAVPKEVAQ